MLFLIWVNNKTTTNSLLGNNLAVVYQAGASIDIRTVIDLKDALREIDKKDYRDGNGTFSIVFMTCNRVKKTGGEIKVIPQAYKCGLPANCKGHEMRGILNMETGKKTAVHNRLIFQVNKHEVYWV